MRRTTRAFAAATLGLLLGATACNDDELFRPLNFVPVDALFERYVSMGNSITAGYQSGGINDSTQVQSYAVLLARQMHTPFFVPLMSRPGCPPPLTNIFTQARVLPPVPNNCALRAAQAVPPPYINNVAVPGAAVMDAVTNLDPASNPNGLTTLFLGGYTQTSMMQKVDPTFITVWLGNNDVLGAATDTADAGNPAKVTDTISFKARYGAALDSIGETHVQGVVLIGVANVTLLPYFVRGTKFYNVKFGSDTIPGGPTTNKFPANFLVDPNCAPPQGDSILVPFPRGAGVVAFARANPTITVGVDCSDVHNISPSEFAKIDSAVTTYNAFIQARATALGYVFADPNALLAALPAGSIPDFPNIPPLATAATAPFGTYFSKDGIHPSATAHKLIANTLIQVINLAYGTQLQPIP